MSSFRISLSHLTTEKEVQDFLKIFSTGGSNNKKRGLLEFQLLLSYSLLGKSLYSDIIYHNPHCYSYPQHSNMPWHICTNCLRSCLHHRMHCPQPFTSALSYPNKKWDPLRAACSYSLSIGVNLSRTKINARLHKG